MVWHPACMHHLQAPPPRHNLSLRLCRRPALPQVDRMLAGDLSEEEMLGSDAYFRTQLAPMVEGSVATFDPEGSRSSESSGSSAGDGGGGGDDAGAGSGAASGGPAGAPHDTTEL